MLKPGSQELEAMEAPGFWTGFSYGVAVRGTAAPSAVVSIAT
ncbi:daptide-type RiPP [Streptomyces rochei]